MLHDLIASEDLMTLPIAGMLFFVVVFAAVLLRTLSRRRAYALAAQLPLDEGEATPREEEQR